MQSYKKKKAQPKTAFGLAPANNFVLLADDDWIQFEKGKFKLTKKVKERLRKIDI